MRKAAEDIAGYILATSEAEFPDLKTERFAVERLVLVLGEAAARVSQAYQLQHPEIPWRALQKARNTVAHNYGRRMAPEIYRQCRSELVPLANLVLKPSAGEEERAL
jgi:uncharacterized protein with HEPN domain